MRVRYSLRAQVQLDTIGDFFQSVEAVGAGTEVLRRIKYAAERLMLFPDSGRVGAVEGTRELSVKGLPYVIVYERFPEDSEDVMVLNVWHCSQERN